LRGREGERERGGEGERERGREGEFISHAGHASRASHPGLTRPQDCKMARLK